jgi:hypothetical protein
LAAAVVLGALVVLTAGVLVVAEPLVVELLLPHPATNAPQSSAATSNEDRLPVIFSPHGSCERSLAAV